MSRIKEAFKNKKAFIGFLTAGDPSLDKTEEFIVEMEKAGAALIEIGIPFSDPIAEGTIIQDANVRALSAPGGCTTDMVFDMVSRVSEKVSVPLVFRTYLNPIFKYGYDAFCKRCREVGIDGIMIPDMPFEEREELLPIAKEYGVDLISTIVRTSKSRIQMIASESQGYIYLMDSTEDMQERNEMIQYIRSVTDTPVAVEVESEALERDTTYHAADGVIVSSAIVKLIGQYGNDAGRYVHDYVKSMTDLYVEER